MIQTRDLQFQYPRGPVMHFPDFSLEDKENCLVLGESGSGKTSFLHLISGLLSPSRGEILIQDKDITQLNAGDMDRFRGEKIAVIFQRPHFISSLSVLDNLLIAQDLVGKDRDPSSALDLLGKLNLKHKALSKTNQLSQGEKQRISIARALVNRPHVILADEPTSALDDKNTDIVVDLLKRVSEEIEANLVVVTHDQRLKSAFENQIILEDTTNPQV